MRSDLHSIPFRHGRPTGAAMLAAAMLLAVSACSLAACRRDGACKVSAGDATFSIRPDDAYYNRLNTVGGYMYFTGGHRGIVVVRLDQTHFAAYDRTCPDDNDSQVGVDESGGWGSSLLECPQCHSRFNVYADGQAIDGSATTCSLYQYSTTYQGGVLYVN